jgi:hypothetical protein
VLPKPPLPPAGDHDPLANFRQVGDQRLPVFFEDLGADRQLQHDVAAGPAGAVLAHAVPARAGLEVLLVAVVDERVQPLHRLGIDMPAASAVATVGPAELDELLAPEADRASAASARAHVDFRLVEEFHDLAYSLQTCHARP